MLKLSHIFYSDKVLVVSHVLSPAQMYWMVQVRNLSHHLVIKQMTQRNGLKNGSTTTEVVMMEMCK